MTDHGPRQGFAVTIFNDSSFFGDPSWGPMALTGLASNSADPTQTYPCSFQYTTTGQMNKGTMVRMGRCIATVPAPTTPLNTVTFQVSGTNPQTNVAFSPTITITWTSASSFSSGCVALVVSGGWFSSFFPMNSYPVTVGAPTFAQWALASPLVP